MSKRSTTSGRRALTGMSAKIAIPLWLVWLSSCESNPGSAKHRLPEEVKRFQASRDLCDHFRGEEGFDAERREFLRQQMKTHCTGTDQALRNLRLRYQGNPTVIESLKKYQDKIE